MYMHMYMCMYMYMRMRDNSLLLLDGRRSDLILSYCMAGGKSPTAKEAAAAAKAANLGKDATPEELAEALKEMQPPKSRAYYRAQAHACAYARYSASGDAPRMTEG